MKKILLIIIILPIMGFSQHIGTNKTDIINHLVGIGITPFEAYDSDVGVYIYASFRNFESIYVFNNDNICIRFAILPVNLKATEEIIKSFKDTGNLAYKSKDLYWWYTNYMIIEMEINRNLNIITFTKAKP